MEVENWWFFSVRLKSPFKTRNIQKNKKADFCQSKSTYRQFKQWNSDIWNPKSSQMLLVRPKSVCRVVQFLRWSFSEKVHFYGARLQPHHSDEGKTNWLILRRVYSILSHWVFAVNNHNNLNLRAIIEFHT